MSEASQGYLLQSRRSAFERRVIGFSVLLALPGLVASAVLAWLQPWALATKLILVAVEVLVCVVIAIALRHRIIRPLQTLSNVVAALREEDYSCRARSVVSNDALGELSQEVNALADFLARNRTAAIEATALVRRVIEEVGIPIFAFDRTSKLRLVNSAAEKLLQQPSGSLLGTTASELGLQISLSCENGSVVALPFAGGARWLVRRSSFRQQGIPHTLVVLSDVSRALREEERRAWQRLIRVIGHEVNNSLTPIKSIAGSLNSRLPEANLDFQQRQDFESGLNIIENRAASLNRFLQAYRELAQMPQPAMRECSIPALVRRVAALESRIEVTVIPGPDVGLTADPDQLEQMLINLLRNAAEAVLELRVSEDDSNGSGSKTANSGSPVTVTWQVTDREVILVIEDDGPGLMNSSNAFVPFYTTKRKGSGIGLVLSRQICEAHGGSLELVNRAGGRGCIATATLPRTASPRNRDSAAENSRLSLSTNGQSDPEANT